MFEEKLQDIKERPEKHHHNFEELQTCCIINEALSLALLDAHERQRCDVVSGPIMYFRHVLLVRERECKKLIQVSLGLSHDCRF